MVFWEIFSSAVSTGFQCELPAGTYYIGDPFVMLLPEFLEKFDYLPSGAFEDVESGNLILLHRFTNTIFSVVDEITGENTILVSTSKILALMSENMVRPVEKYEDERFVLTSPTVVDVNTESETFELENSECTVMTVCHFEMDSDCEFTD